MKISKELPEFVKEIEGILDAGQQKYGHTFDVLAESMGGERSLCYTLAEKAVRYSKTGNENDLFKIATYAYLMWRYRKLCKFPHDLYLGDLNEVAK